MLGASRNGLHSGYKLPKKANFDPFANLSTGTVYGNYLELALVGPKHPEHLNDTH